MWTGDQFEIVEADPRITITDEFIDRVRQGYGHPNISLVDDVLTMRGTNRTVVYRLVEHVPAVGITQSHYRAEWPD